MLKYLKPYTESALNIAVRFAPRISPNFITIAGLIPPALFCYFLTTGQIGWAILCYIGALFDLVDGAYARATNQTSKFGSVLDSSLDRISDAVVIAAFGFAAFVPWWMCIAVIIASFMISYVRARGESLLEQPRALAVGPIERPERLALIFLGLIAYALAVNVSWRHDIIPVTFVILLTLSIVTFIRRLNAAK